MAATKSLTFEIFGKDRSASATMDKVGKSATTAGDRFKRAGQVIGIGMAVVGAAALKLGVDSLKAYAEAEESQKRLSFAFEKFPKLADTNQKALQDLNTELQKKTKYDDDAIASAQAVLAQFNLTGEQLKKVTPLMLDYASATGKDVNNAAMDVGKALLGNAKALKNVGVAYKSTGDATTDFNNIFDLMTSKVGGFADKEGSTAIGKLAIMNNQLGEIEEKIGSLALPIVSDVIDKAATKVIPDWQKFLNGDEATQNEMLAQFWETLGAKLALGWEQMDLGGKMGNGWTQIVGAFDVGWASLAASGEHGLQQIGAYFGQIGPMFQASIDGWGAKFANGWNQITGFFTTIGTAIYTFSAQARANFVKVGEDMMQGLTNGITSNVARAIGSIRKVGTDMLNGIKDILGIKSPSKKFAWVGQMMGAGLIGGLDGSRQGVNASIRRLVSIPDVSVSASSSMAAGSGGHSSVTNNNFYSAPIRDNDPRTSAAIMGREFSRAVAG